MIALPDFPRRRSENDRPIATIQKNVRQAYRVALRPDAAGAKAIIALHDTDPNTGVEHHLHGLAVRVDLVPALVNALLAAAAQAGAAR